MFKICLLTRGVMGLSDVCSYNSAVGLMMGLFPGKDSTVFATSETLISLGYSLGNFNGLENNH